MQESTVPVYHAPMRRSGIFHRDGSGKDAVRLRVGLIGAGSVVREIYQHLFLRSAYTPLLEVAAVTDPNPEARAWAAKVFEGCRTFADHREMLSACTLDAVQINTPDSLHRQPALDALEAGCDVVAAKPIATSVGDGQAMIRAASAAGRLLLVDFHKRRDPRIMEACTRYRAGRYGRLQVATLWMLDRLSVADPNRHPRFFSSADFAERHTPVSFLGVHMVDTLIHVTGLTPLRVRATGFSHTLPSLSPVAVQGWDVVDTEVSFAGGAVAHVVSGWHLPDTAPSLTVQSGRLICSGGMVDLDLDTPGYREIHAEGLAEVNPLFLCRAGTGTRGGPGTACSGYGIESPGDLFRLIADHRAGRIPAEARAELLSPQVAGLTATAVVEAAETSLARGESADGVTAGPSVDLTA